MTSSWDNIEEKGIYTDLVRKFNNEGHSVYIMYPNERRLNKTTSHSCIKNIHLLGVRTLNLTKTNIVEKGIGQLLIEKQFICAFDRYYSDVRFDIILYSTPPITFTNVIEHARKFNPEAMTYLLLKDIFPQNAVDLGMLSKTGMKSILYNFFKKKEERLYSVSDYIGCMSPANVEYLLLNNPNIEPNRVEIAPNSCEIPPDIVSNRNAIRRKYGLPQDLPIFIYGGNLGKPQGIPFLIECMDSVKNRKDSHFIVIGNGTDSNIIERWFRTSNPSSVSFFNSIPKDDYALLVNACDIGLIFLNYRFTIPNYPSRLLSYMVERKPVLAVSDLCTDIGNIAEKNGYGFWCPSNSVDSFVNCVDKILASDIKKMGDNAYEYFINNYTIEHTYQAIIRHLN